MNVTIVGGGNIGTQTAVHCAEKGHSVIIYSNRYAEFSDTLQIVNEKNIVIHQAKIKAVTNEPETAFGNADVVILAVPAFCFPYYGKLLEKYISKPTIIGCLPGSGGIECMVNQCIKNECTLFGLQRVPSVARLTEYGKTVKAVGYRDRLYLSAIPFEKANKCADLISNIFDIPCSVLPNYLNVTLIPSNQILHTTRLYSIFHEYNERKTYKEIPLFYEDWDDASSELLFLCDAEVQEICKAFPEFDLTGVKSLKDHYESYSIHAMTQKITSIKSLKGLSTPSIQYEDGYIPDFDSRYFTADFPFGLSIVKQIAKFGNVDTPNIDKVLTWYKNVCTTRGSEFSYKFYGVEDRKDFIEFYKR